MFSSQQTLEFQLCILLANDLYQQSYILTDKLMGNRLPQQKGLTITSPSSHPQSLFSPRYEHNYLIRQILTQSPQQHQQLITTITKYKQYQHPNIIKLMDSHTVQSHNLCSVLSHLYVMIEKPSHTFEEYCQQIKTIQKKVNDRELQSILVGCCKGILYLRNQGHDISHIQEQLIFIDQVANDKIVPKVMNPHFTDDFYQEAAQDTVQKQLALIVRKLVNYNTSAEIVRVIEKLEHGDLTLNQTQAEFRGQTHTKRGKSGLKLIRNIRKERVARESIGTIISNGSSSLMIDGGDVSDLMLKDFYQPFDDSLSQISMNNQSEAISDFSHQFPKKYIKNKAFKKQNKTFTSSEWLQTKTLPSDNKSTSGYHITRDQSMKQNIHFQLRPFMLGSAKLVQSFVDK